MSKEKDAIIEEIQTIARLIFSQAGANTPDDDMIELVETAIKAEGGE
jgi:hypothetical protein